MKRLIRVFLSKFLDNDCYYVFQVDVYGRDTFSRMSGTYVPYRASWFTEYSLTRREAYIQGKIDFSGKVISRF